MVRCVTTSLHNCDHFQVRSQNCEKRLLVFLMSVRPHGTTRLPNGRIFMTFDILNIFRKKSVEKLRIPFKSDQNNRHFTLRPTYIFDHISLSSSYSEKRLLTFPYQPVRLSACTNSAPTERIFMKFYIECFSWKATVNVFISARPSGRIDELGSHWTDFHEILYWVFFVKSDC